MSLQACSGIEDFGEALMHLEAANWNLLEALQVVMPQEAATPANPTLPPPLNPVPQVSPERIRICKIYMQVEELRNWIFPLVYFIGHVSAQKCRY